MVSLLLRYEIKEDGTIIDLQKNKEVKFCLDQKGYLKARLYTPLSNHPDGRKSFRLHRIVAMKYLPDYSDDLQVNHKDGNKTNNHYSNLEMVTNAQNAKHGWNVLDSTERKNKLNARRLPNGKFS